ncbi:hypothetical protein NX059_005286 [Plenodomus lindquistii]|nr:hypothetical protein NX059_005286 [Plenodomus lindquistii]
MATTHSNLAVTRDGETYNKLSRPDDYLTSTTPLLPPLSPAVRPLAQSNKRKRGRDATVNSKSSKRTKDAEVSTCLDDNADKRDKKDKWWSTGDYGMRTILPGVDDDVESTEGSIDEAMAYLRSVRSEASKIPPLLVAQASASTDDVEDTAPTRDHTGKEDGVFYEDGVWIAVDSAQNSAYGTDPATRYSSLQPQHVYYDQILVRFQSLRTKLLEAGFARGTRTASEVRSQPRSKRAWLDIIDVVLPTSDHIGQLDEAGLFHALEACSASLGRDTSISREKSCWIWTLLAMASEAGTLDSRLVGKIRSLGLQAGRLGARLQHKPFDQPGVVQNIHNYSVDAPKKTPDYDTRDTDTAAELEDDAARVEATLCQSQAVKAAPVSTLSETEDERAQTLEEARARLLAQLGDRLVPSECPEQGEVEDTLRGVKRTSLADPIDWNTKATIDMILTVVAERYGQRDLLKFREAW